MNLVRVNVVSHFLAFDVVFLDVGFILRDNAPDPFNCPR